MKTVVLHNVDISCLTTNDKLYLEGARVTPAISPSNKDKKSTIFLTWDDRKYDGERKEWDENLSPRPADRVCDFIEDMWEGSPIECETLCEHIKHMNFCQTLHYDVQKFTYDI